MRGVNGALGHSQKIQSSVPNVATLSTSTGSTTARVGMSLTRLGWGAAARLVLYGGFDEAGFAPEVHLFDVGRRRWCGAEDRPAVRGRAPSPRAAPCRSSLRR